MEVEIEHSNSYKAMIALLVYSAIFILGFVVGRQIKFKESVGSPDYEKSEIEKEITSKLIDYDISRTDGSQRSIDSVRSEYKGKKYIAKSTSSIIYLEDGRKVTYSCTEDNKLLSLQIIGKDSSITRLK